MHMDPKKITGVALRVVAVVAITMVAVAGCIALTSGEAHAGEKRPAPTIELPPQQAVAPAPVWRDTWSASNWEQGIIWGAPLALAADQLLESRVPTVPRRLGIMSACVLGVHAWELEDKHDPDNGYSRKGVFATTLGCALGLIASDRIIVYRQRGSGATMVGWIGEW